MNNEQSQGKFYMREPFVASVLGSEAFWKTGDTCTFTYRFPFGNVWEFTLTREEASASLPYILRGRELGGTGASHGRRYKTMEDAFLHILNRLNKNHNVRNNYTSVYQWIGCPIFRKEG